MLICDLLNKNNIDKYQVEGLIINSKEFSTFNDQCYSKDELAEVISLIKKASKKVFLSCDRIIEEFDIERYFEYLDYIKQLDVDYLIFSDLATLEYHRLNTLNCGLIYDSKTMITNKYDSLLYKERGVKVMISNEITLEDMISISETNNAGLEVYGYHQIFYSRRRIFDSYNQYKETNYPYDDKLMHLKEEFRQGLYPIYQSEFGTFVYNAELFMLCKELPRLKSLEFVKINASFIPEESLFSIISVYNRALSDRSLNDLNSLEEELKAINDNVTKGFLYNGSILLKENE